MVRFNQAPQSGPFSSNEWSEETRQVTLLQVLNFKRGHRTQAILNRFNQLSLDFLILNPDTSIVAAVELDDATHARENKADGVYKLVRRYALALGLKIGAHALRAIAATNALDHQADITACRHCVVTTSAPLRG